MHHRLPTLVYIFCFFLSTMQPPAQAADITVFQGATIIDGRSATPLRDAVLVVEGAVIRYLGTKSGYTVPAGARVVDLTGKSVIPGLFDMHVHMGITEGHEISADLYNQARIQRDVQRHLAFGVMHVVSLGFDRQVIFDVREAQRKNASPGARIHTAGSGFAPVGGWRTPVPPGATKDTDWYNRPESVDDARRLVRKEAARKADIIKVWVDDGRGQYVKMTPEYYGAIIDEAHKNNLKVVAHIVYLDDAKDLLRRKVDAFAHSVRDRMVDNEFLQLAKSYGFTLIPTLSGQRMYPDYAEENTAHLSHPRLAKIFGREFLEELRKSTAERARNMPTLASARQQFDVAMENARLAVKAGIPLTTGTDTGVPGAFPGLGVHREMEYLVQAGLSPAQAIQAASLNGARLLGIDNKYGTLEAGMVADFIILNADPTTDIKNTREIFAVWMEGKPVDEPQESRDAVDAHGAPAQ
ncbi:MAG: amidohydrolase family protein [Acidobacteria bacterium]|nr:amidohydrolase family protein [Acidobacteriota bacterium]